MDDWRERLAKVAKRSNCRLTTRGRKTGRRHTVTIWFALGPADTIYLATLRMNRDWPKNLQVHSDVEIEVDGVRVRGEARVVTEPAERERIDAVLRSKYLVSRIGGWLGFGPEGVFEIRLSGEATGPLTPKSP